MLSWQFGGSTHSSSDRGQEEGDVSLAYGPPKLFFDLPVNSRFAVSESANSRSANSRRLLGRSPLESYNGHTFIVEDLGSPTLFVDGANYMLREFHTHTPSEHTIDGTQFDMEIQFVHTLQGSGGDKYVIISVFFNAREGGSEPPFLPQLASAMSNEHFGPQPRWILRSLKFQDIADSLQSYAHMTSYYKYRGSLTQPPCTESVTWFIIKSPISVHSSTLNTFQRLEGQNARPVQPSAERLVEFTP